MRRQTGEHVRVGSSATGYVAFVPAPLPPVPPLATDPELDALRDRANRALGRLDGISDVLPDARLFLYQYVRKEALLSSQIEGTQSSFSDLLLFELDEAPGVPMDDVREVSNYVAALNHGLERMQGGFPLSLRLLRDMHGILLADSRGAEKDPGEFRRSQVWLGGPSPGNAPFVPPPPDRLMECLDAFERFLHGEPERLPVLVRTALAHVQFETIHPFLDGNGRIGRLLITLLLCAEGVVNQPTLYLSLYFKAHREEYYDRLQAVRTDGDWEGWLRFFLEGVFETSQQAVSTAQRVLALFAADRERLRSLGRRAGSALRVHECLERRPILSVPETAAELDLSAPTVRGCIESMEAMGMAREITGRERRRLYCYDAYIALLAEGTEPLPR
jgi:Fic family protein